jgi:hypothetical protein
VTDQREKVTVLLPMGGRDIGGTFVHLPGEIPAWKDAVARRVADYKLRKADQAYRTAHALGLERGGHGSHVAAKERPIVATGARAPRVAARLVCLGLVVALLFSAACWWLILTRPYFAAAFGLSASVALAVTAIVRALAEGRR